MTHKSKKNVFWGQFIDSGAILLVAFFLYQPIYNFFINLPSLNEKAATYITGTALALVCTVLKSCIALLLSSGVISNIDVSWLIDGKHSVKLIYTPVSHPTKDVRQPLKRIVATVSCTPKRPTLFSLMSLLGMGIIIYDSGNSFGFTKSGASNPTRYSVIDGKKVFIKSFYRARKGDKGNSWNISFDIQVSDLSIEHCYLYCGVAIGTPGHKRILPGRLIQLDVEPLTIEIINGGEHDGILKK